MAWMMMLCCLAPILLLFVFGTGFAKSGASTWVILGLIAVMVIHLFMMVRRARSHSDQSSHAHEGNGDSDSHSGHACCK